MEYGSGQRIEQFLEIECHRNIHHSESPQLLLIVPDLSMSNTL